MNSIQSLDNLIDQSKDTLTEIKRNRKTEKCDVLLEKSVSYIEHMIGQMEGVVTKLNSNNNVKGGMRKKSRRHHTRKHR
jgi:uncharacterized protein Yka (UPF0111/DUF47 family)